MLEDEEERDVFGDEEKSAGPEDKEEAEVQAGHEDTRKGYIASPGVQSVQENSPQEILQMGFSFFGKMAQVLSDKKKTQEFVSTIVKKDEDGQAYLKIPVESEKAVENVLAMITGLMGKMK